MKICHNDYRRLILTIFTLFLLTAPVAAEEAPEQYPPATLSLLDRTHQNISEALSAPSRWFDNFFSDPRVDEEAAGTYLRVRTSVTYAEGGDTDFTGKVKAHLRLPSMKRRFHLILSSEEDDLRDATLTDARINRELADTNEDTSLALQYTQKRTTGFSLLHRVGLDLENGLNPRVRSRLRYTLPIDALSILNFTQAVFWEKNDGFGEETRIDHDLPLLPTTLLRTTVRGLFSESSNGYEWLGMLQLLQSFSHKKALSFGGYVVGETRPQNQVTEYTSFVKYRQKFIKKWLFFEIRPELSWPREQDFKATTAITLTLEMQFGKE